METKNLQEKAISFLTENRKSFLNVSNTLSKKYNIKVLYLRLAFIVTVFYGVGAYLILYFLIQKKLFMFADIKQDDYNYDNMNVENSISEIKSDFNQRTKQNINQLNLNNMEYKIEQVGAEFSNKAIKGLESRFNSYADQGYKFHSVFQVQKPGCLGFGSPSITYLAVYVKE